MPYPRRNAIPSLLIILIFLILISGCDKAPIVKKTKLLMGTWVTVKVHDQFKTPEDITKIIDKAFLGMDKVDKLMSRFREDSEVSQINKLKPMESMKVSAETLYVINKANELHKITDGAFDITVSPILRLWGFYDEDFKVPSKEDIQKVKESVGHENISVNREYGYVSLTRQGVEIDLGGIATGFAVDEAINILKREGIRNALIDAGGDIYCLGMGANKKPWNIGIKHPRANKIITTLKLKDIAVTTSGDYEKYFIINDKRFSHIIDPTTGYPVADCPISVTVLAGDCITADGLATALMVLGPERGLKLVNRLHDVEAIFISKNPDSRSLKIDVSDGLKGLYEFDE